MLLTFTWDGSLPRAPKRRYVRDLVRTTAPEGPLVDPADLKKQLDVVRADQDEMIGAFEAAATGSLDGYGGELGRALLRQTWTQYFDHGFPAHRISLLLPPLIEVASVKYFDVDGVEQTLDPAAYLVLDGPVAAIEPAPCTCWPITQRRTRAVSIEYVCGYGAAADVPAPIVTAVKLIVGSLYANREGTVIDSTRVTVVENLTLDRLLGPLSAKEL